MRARIAAAFEPFSGRVPEQRAKVLVDLLTLIGGQAEETPHAAFRAISPQSTDLELKLLAHHSRELVQLFDGMHSTTIAALADVTIDGGTPYTLNIRVVRTQLGPALRMIEVISMAAAKELAKQRLISRQLAYLDGEWLAQERKQRPAPKASVALEARGAPPKGRAIAVGDMLANFFAETGMAPTPTKGGPFFKLVKAVFAAMEIDAKPSGVVNTACQRWRAKKRPYESDSISRKRPVCLWVRQP